MPLFTRTFPAGSNGQVQYNDSTKFGAFGLWDGSALVLPSIYLGGVAAFETPLSVYGNLWTSTIGAFTTAGYETVLEILDSGRVQTSPGGIPTDQDLIATALYSSGHGTSILTPAGIMAGAASIAPNYDPSFGGGVTAVLEASEYVYGSPMAIPLIQARGFDSYTQFQVWGDGAVTLGAPYAGNLKLWDTANAGFTQITTMEGGFAFNDTSLLSQTDLWFHKARLQDFFTYSDWGEAEFYNSQWYLKTGTGGDAVLNILQLAASDSIHLTSTNNTVLGGVLETSWNMRKPSGTPTNGFGLRHSYYLKSSTTNSCDAGYDIVSWVDATHATRKARRDFGVADAAQNRLALRMEADGTQPLLGFFGSAAVARQARNAYTTNAQSSAYTTTGAGADIASKADLNLLRVAYENLRASYDDLRTKIGTSTLMT